MPFRISSPGLNNAIDSTIRDILPSASKRPRPTYDISEGVGGIATKEMMEKMDQILEYVT